MPHGYLLPGYSPRAAIATAIADGLLYSVRQQIRSWPETAQIPKRPTQVKESLVFCSPKRPTYIFSGVSGVPKQFIAHRLSPSGGWSGYNWDSHLIYWFACHGRLAKDDTAAVTARLARSLGYPPELPTEQVEGTTLAEILP
ncbi:MAG: hypothetical protein HC919_05760 [Oscillatoriales cyanobacterium SM2_2_1]|nr:hypothetical protein [Oscillatoriales cyanobacterium SM2_2_1]